MAAGLSGGSGLQKQQFPEAQAGLQGIYDLALQVLVYGDFHHSLTNH